MQTNPVLNITMPVFNRFETTQRCILALRKSARQIPFSLTVVDNGSDEPLREKLVEFADQGLIDKLFLLPRNMGISCAANLGWRMTDAPYYMKLDNDMLLLDRDWLPKLFRLWRHGDPQSTLGGAFTREMLIQDPGRLETADGILGICTTNLAGQAIIIPKTVSDILGYWNEDYDLYGAEDGDYGLRMTAAGYLQYYYLRTDYFEDLSADDIKQTYTDRGIDRAAQHQALFKDQDGNIGLFVLNSYLFSECVRAWKPMQKYAVQKIDGYHVEMSVRPEYLEFRKDLEQCRKMVNDAQKLDPGITIFTPEFQTELKRILSRTGQDSETYVKSLQH